MKKYISGICLVLSGVLVGYLLPRDGGECKYWQGGCKQLMLDWNMRNVWKNSNEIDKLIMLWVFLKDHSGDYDPNTIKCNIAFEFDSKLSQLQGARGSLSESQKEDLRNIISSQKKTIKSFYELNPLPNCGDEPGIYLRKYYLEAINTSN